MAINPHDDYEALAKLLYPSIEASGNVYYGQTRKLAIDELFDKNNNGFEAYVDSIRVDDEDSDYGYKYQKCFCWKLGPFSDVILIEKSRTYDDSLDIPVAWYKYSLTKKDIKKGIIINNASYNTYEIEYELSDPTFVSSLDGLLPNGNVYDGRNFFISEENGTLCLYILFHKAPVYEDVDKPLYIEALTDDIEISLAYQGNISTDQYKYKYGSDYTNLSSDLIVDDVYTVKKGCRIYIRCEDKPEFSSENYVHFEIDSEDENAEVVIGGNLSSMAKVDANGEIQENEYYRLFENNTLITDASKLYIDKLQDLCCVALFHKCTRLKNAPAILPCTELKRYCYDKMFFDCPLENSIILPASVGVDSCYSSMFGKVSLSNPPSIVLCCLLKEHNDSYTDSWLFGRHNGNIYVLSGVYWSENVHGIPEDCTRHNITSTYVREGSESIKQIVNTEKYLVTHGTNNSNNGRGDITYKSTLGNMEKSFDENGTHPMNTYNADGSFNQEIWGYKSFCSPVQFRNGVYGENWSVYIFDYGRFSREGRSVTISQNADTSASIQICRSTSIGSNNRSIILSSEKPATNYLNSDAAIVEVKYDNDSGTSITLQADQMFLNGSTKLTGNLDLDGSIYTTGSVIPNRSTVTGNISTSTLGTDDTRFSSIYANRLDGSELHLGSAEISLDNTHLTVSSPNGIVINDHTEFYNGLYVEGTLSAIEDFSCGGNSNFMSEITADSGITSHGDIIVDNGKKFKGNLDGVIPYVERDSFAEDHIVPVGCIVFLKIKDITSDKMWATYNPYEIGTEFTREDNSTMDIRIGGFGESGMLEDADAPELVGRQTFRTLSRCEFSENGVAYVLAIRVK